MKFRYKDKEIDMAMEGVEYFEIRSFLEYLLVIKCKRSLKNLKKEIKENG